MSLRDAGEPEWDKAVWRDMLATMGAGMAFIWLGTDYWFFGLWAIVSLVASFRASIEVDRGG